MAMAIVGATEALNIIMTVCRSRPAFAHACDSLDGFSTTAAPPDGIVSAMTGNCQSVVEMHLLPSHKKLNAATTNPPKAVSLVIRSFTSQRAVPFHELPCRGALNYVRDDVQCISWSHSVWSGISCGSERPAEKWYCVDALHHVR